MEGLKRARAFKARIENDMSVLQNQDKKASSSLKAQDGQENQLIKKLRLENKMSWKHIVKALNSHRKKYDGATNFTKSAVYSRFVLSTTTCATPARQIGFDPKDYIHLRLPNHSADTNNISKTSRAGTKRVKNYDNATELQINLRRQLSTDEHADLETVERTEQLMHAVAKVRENFWVLVADELERMTTKWYTPDELERRYHAV